jgi:hypothetical protein
LLNSADIAAINQDTGEIRTPEIGAADEDLGLGDSVGGFAAGAQAVTIQVIPNNNAYLIRVLLMILWFSAIAASINYISWLGYRWQKPL